MHFHHFIVFLGGKKILDNQQKQVKRNVPFIEMVPKLRVLFVSASQVSVMEIDLEG